MTIQIKRAYESPTEEDGVRILVDRLWPRGISRESGRIDWWARELAPSSELRRWYGHDPGKWPEFRARYFAELDARRERVEELLDSVRRGSVTLVYSSRERQYNNATALREYLESRIG